MVENGGTQVFKIKNIFGYKVTTSHEVIMKTLTNFHLFRIKSNRTSSKLLRNPLKEEGRNEKLLCPAFYLMKCHFYNSFDFKPSNKFTKNLTKAIESKNKIEETGMKLELWEELQIEFFTSIVNKNEQRIFEIFNEYSKAYPNDLYAYTLFKVFIICYAGTEKLQLMKGLVNLFYDRNKILHILNGKIENEFDLLQTIAHSFSLEESEFYEDANILSEVGLKADPTSLYLMHTQIHIIQADLKFSESIKYFYDHTNSLTGDTKQYGGDFIHQHIHWHIAIAYLFEDSVSEKIVATSENFSKSIGFYKIVLTTYYHDTECFVNIFGYLVWVYLRSQGEINIIFFLENQIISESNLNKFKSIISDPTNYTKHTLFDYFSVWLLKELKMEEELINVRNQINQNIEEINNHAKVTEEAKKFYSEVYPKIISAFSDYCLLSKESDKLLKECQKYFYFNSGSKEQTSILEEILKRLG